MEMGGFMGGLYRITEWIMRLSVINLLWIFCGLPFWLLFLMALMAPDADTALSTLFLAGLTTPLTLFPPTAATFSVARKWVMGDTDVPLFRTFFRGYKENFLQSLFGGVLIAILYFALFFYYRFYGSLENNFSFIAVVFFVLFVLCTISVFHFFSIMVHMHMKTLQIMKNAFLLTIGRPGTSLMMAISNGAAIFISMQRSFGFLVPFFLGSVIAYLSFSAFYRIFSHIQEQAEKAKERENEEAAEDDGEEAGADLLEETQDRPDRADDRPKPE